MGRGQVTGGSATAIRAPLAEESDSSSADADRSDLLELLTPKPVQAGTQR